jgi:hypothetical protein
VSSKASRVSRTNASVTCICVCCALVCVLHSVVSAVVISLRCLT